MNYRILCASLGLVAALASPHAAGQVVDPALPVAGISQLALAEQWAKWALETPAASNPLFDSTGAFAGVNNGGPVYFLAGNTGGLAERSFNVEAGKPLFFPIINSFDLEVPSDGCDLKCASAFLSDIAGASHVHATLDGKDLLTFPSYRQTSTAFFDINLPASVRDELGFPERYVGHLDAIVDGYWVALEGLSPGNHTLVFGGTLPGATPFTLEVIDHVNAVPEPGTAAMLLAGIALLGWVSRGRRALPRSTYPARTVANTC